VFELLELGGVGLRIAAIALRTARIGFVKARPNVFHLLHRRSGSKQLWGFTVAVGHGVLIVLWLWPCPAANQLWHPAAGVDHHQWLVTD